MSAKLMPYQEAFAQLMAAMPLSLFHSPVGHGAFTIEHVRKAIDTFDNCTARGWKYDLLGEFYYMTKGSDDESKHQTDPGPD